MEKQSSLVIFLVISSKLKLHSIICCYFHHFVHFLCLPKENEPKEKALYRQVFFKDRLK